MAQGDYPVGRTLPENAVPARYAPSAGLTPHAACQFLCTRYQQLRRHRGCYAAQHIADPSRCGTVAKVPFCSHTHYRMRHRGAAKHTVRPDALGGDRNRETWKFKRLTLVICECRALCHKSRRHIVENLLKPVPWRACRHINADNAVLPPSGDAARGRTHGDSDIAEQMMLQNMNRHLLLPSQRTPPMPSLSRSVSVKACPG